MTNKDGASPSTDLHDLKQRVETAQQRYDKPVNDDNTGSLLGMAWRLSTELLVSVLVGAGLGYGLDRLLGTKPWLLILGLGFGFAAGIRGVIRIADRMDAEMAAMNDQQKAHKPD